MSKNVPVDEKLWAEIQALAKGESNKPVSRGKESVNPVNEGKGFVTFPSAYANGWALAQYKRLGGKWKKESSDFKKPRKWDKEHCESKTCDEMGFSEKASCRPYKNCYKKSASLIPLSKFVKDVVLSGGRYDFSPTRRGRPSLNGMKLSIQGRTVDDIFEVYQILGGYLKSNQIEYKLATVKRLEKASGPQKHKVMTIYIPDDVDDWRQSAEEVSVLLHEHSYRGWHNLSTPPNYEHYANAVFFRNDRDEYGDYIPASKYAGKRDDPKMKNTGKGGLGTWFAGHGGGDPDERATWGDWVAVTPIKHTITKDDGKKKTYEPGDIVGPCAISSEPDWGDVTSGGKKPLKCMPREKAWQMSKEERAELAKKKRREEAKHRGQKPVNTPTFSEEAKEVTKKKASASRVAHLYLFAAVQPAQDLGGVKTWVDKTRQDQIKNDTNPEESRADYADGKPQRDRVLPLPSGHPEGRDEQRVGPGVINSPPDSSGQGGANRPQKDPSALNDHPDGKALHERPRSSGIPGDQYGNPHIDQSTSTGLKRRVMGSVEEDFYWDLEGDDLIKIALFRYNHRPPKGDKRQREQKGQAKRKSQINKRQNRVKYRRQLLKQKREHKRKKHNPTYKKYKKNYNNNPELYNRRPGGGVSTVSQKNKRSEKRRKKADHE